MYKIPVYSKDSIYSGLPNFYDESKDCRIKIDNKWYYDFSVMGASACILGYRDNYVNYHVKKCIDKGNWSSLNSRYMDKLTNLLLAMHPFLDTVRYCKCGGEALKLAYDLVIEKIKKDKIKVLQVGYNGWEIKNLKNDYKTLIEHMDNIDEIKNIKHIPNIIIFELVRHEYPSPQVINKLKEWQKQGTILIMDEVTTGFRFLCGGIHKLYYLEPDILVYAKGISNGYPMACIIGKKEIMESDLWISSTYWSDSIGFVAAYYTIKKLKHCKYSLLIKLGNTVMNIWKRLANIYNIKIKVGEVPNIANFEFDYDNKLLLKNLFIEKMQEYGILALDQFYPTFSHNSKAIQKYIYACNKSFEFISCHLNEPEKHIKNRIEVLNK